MNIPIKYEDVSAKLDAALAREAAERLRADVAVADCNEAERREAALREENKLLQHDVASYLETTAKVCELLGIDVDAAKNADGKPSDVLLAHAQALQQRLTDAEKRSSEFEGLLHMSKELLTTISRHGATTKPNDWCDSFKAEVADRIEKIGIALKPVEDSKEPARICDGCGSQGWTANCDKCIPY